MTDASSKWPVARADVLAAIAIVFLAVPQGIAYALIAGLPPVMGLYAAAVPVVIGAIARSSTHVVTGPTNALSLLVGGAAVVVTAPDPMVAATALALMVGVFQFAAGALRLGALVDYISTSVVVGYITAAGVLIGIGQLGNLTRTERTRGDLVTELLGWVDTLPDTHMLSLVVGLVSFAALLVMRRFTPKAPGAVVVIAAGIALSYIVDLQDLGLRLVRDIAPVPLGLPPLTLPVLGTLNVATLAPVAVAATVLSLVESSAVARDIASRTGQRLDTNREFLGQGLANIAAGLFGGYPTSGSLARSAINESVGRGSRWSGVLAGLLMVGVLLVLGPVVDRVPVACLAGLLLMIAMQLVNVREIANVFRSGWGDRIAFTGTVLGAFALTLDQAIYIGVGLSIVLFLRRARNLTVRELRLVNGRLQETDDDEELGWMADNIRILHMEGALFFGAANELRDALDDFAADDDVKVLVVRLKRTHGLDYTTVSVLEDMHTRLGAQGRELLLVGMRERAMGMFERSGAADVIGREHLYPTQPGWFQAMDQALRHAVETVGPEGLGPLIDYLNRRTGRQAPPRTSEH